MTDTTKRFNPTDKAILEATETMLRWGLPAEVILKAVEHLKGLQRLRDIEMECKAGEIQAAIMKQEQAAEHRACGVVGCVAPVGHTSGCVTREVLEALRREACEARAQAHLKHQANASKGHPGS